MVVIRLTPQEAQKLTSYLERARYHPAHWNKVDAPMILNLQRQVRGAVKTLEQTKGGA